MEPHCEVIVARWQVMVARWQVMGAKCQVMVAKCQVMVARCQVMVVRCQVMVARYRLVPPPLLPHSPLLHHLHDDLLTHQHILRDMGVVVHQQVQAEG